MAKLLVGGLFVVCLLYTGFKVIAMAAIILHLVFAGDEFEQLSAFFGTMSDNVRVGLLVLIEPVLLVYLAPVLGIKYNSF